MAHVSAALSVRPGANSSPQGGRQAGSRPVSPSNWSSTGAPSGTAAGAPNRPGVPSGARATDAWTNPSAAAASSGWQAYGCPVATARSQPCTSTSSLGGGGQVGVHVVLLRGAGAGSSHQ